MPVSNKYCSIHGSQLELDGSCSVCIEEDRRNALIEGEWIQREI